MSVQKKELSSVDDPLESTARERRQKFGCLRIDTDYLFSFLFALSKDYYNCRKPLTNENRNEDYYLKERNGLRREFVKDVTCVRKYCVDVTSSRSANRRITFDIAVARTEVENATEAKYAREGARSNCTSMYSLLSSGQFGALQNPLSGGFLNALNPVKVVLRWHTRAVNCFIITLLSNECGPSAIEFFLSATSPRAGPIAPKLSGL